MKIELSRALLLAIEPTDGDSQRFPDGGSLKINGRVASACCVAKERLIALSRIAATSRYAEECISSLSRVAVGIASAEA